MEEKLNKGTTDFLKLIFLLIIVTSSFNLSATKNVGSLNLNLEKVYHEGDLIIQGDEEFIIDGKEFTMSDGNIYIYDNSKLIIRNSNFIFLTEYHAERAWEINNFGRIEIINSEIQTPNQSGTIPENEVVTHFRDNSSLYIDNSIVHGLCLTGFDNSYFYINESKLTDNLYPFPELREPIPGNEARVEVVDSDIHILGLTFPSNSKATLSGLHQGLIDYFDLSGEGLGYHIIIKNTSVFALGVKVDMNAELAVHNSIFSGIAFTNLATLKVYNSELGDLLIQQQEEIPYTCELRNLKSGYFDYFNLNDCSYRCGLNLVLENTTLNSWSLQTNQSLILKDSKDIHLHLGGSAKVEVYNSHIEEFWSLSYGYDGEGLAEVIWEDSIINTWTNFMRCDFTFKGCVEIVNAPLVSPAMGPCVDAKVKREFPVWTYTGGGRTAGVHLQVFDSQGNEIWSGNSDETGEAFFDISFDCSNYNKEYTLQSQYLGSEIKFKLGSSTPLIIPQYSLILTSEIGGITDPEPGTYAYDPGTEVTIEALPESGYRFSEWTGDVPSGNENENPITITMDSDKSITANFIRQYTLTMSAGSGGTTDPAPRSYTHDSGTEVTITATPEIGYRFSGWTGDVPSGHDNDNPITITMDSDKSIEANFIRQCTLSIAVGAGGTTDPSPGTYTYDEGAEVAVMATPESGYRFSEWSGDVSGTDNPITITMDSDKSVKANFIRQYILTIIAGEGGTTDPAPGSYTHDSGAEVFITAIPSSGYEFSGWSGNASGIELQIKITMDSDKSVTANFAAKEKKAGKIGGGNESSSLFGLKLPCFIATAAYGSQLHPHLDILREFRDKYLMTNSFGRALVALYYKYSPSVANIIARHKTLKVIVRNQLVPLVIFSYSMVHLGTICTAIILVFIFVLPFFFILFHRRKINKC